MLRAAAGQASVELVAMLPLAAIVALALGQALAAGAVAELADHAAEAGAVAIAEGLDPAQAARASVPGWSRGGLQVRVRGRRVVVKLRPPAVLPPLAGLLAASAHADAGPA